MTFLEAIQRGSAAYKDNSRTAYVFRGDGGLYDLQADVPAGLYSGSHDLARVIHQLRNLGVPLDQGWDVFKRRVVRL